MSERIAFRMKVHPGRIAEYKKRHDEIWPELVDALRAAGITDYSIWHDPETDCLFATLIRSDDHTMADLPKTDANKRWWAFMDDIMDYNPDGTPTVVRLDQVFHLE
ncbi:L-rhamnose mutarotase [Kaistia soli DSM 19436]|uniref:L-rhamnose mutarotase n=1 Tax=Kaistia soli DSM 19436 TaxID=1122133 RepID=A0A1M4Y0W5_9HYPH|nr:L-rhamnose mutarotase [Kaistia soli]SHE99310.1 L-rhamnose mutarotase [Kaistia soli DSM 19436]